MKKRIAVLLSAAMIMGLTACSSGGKTEGASTTATETGKTEKAETSVQNGESASDGFADAPVVKMQFAENQPSTADVGILGEEFCKKVAEQTNNTVQIEFYGDGLLGDEASVVAGIEAGTIEFTRVNLASMQATVPEVGVLTLPYLYKDAKHCYDVLNSQVGQDIMDKCQDYGFVGLRLFGGQKDNKPTGFRCFYASSPINSLADLKGKKIRVQESEIVIKMVEALGGVATPMAYGEVFQALQTGVIDVAENDPASYYLSGHYEVAKYFTYDNHQISPNMYLMSQKAYDAMTPEQMEVFLKCLDEYIEESSDAMTASIEEYVQKAKDSGCEFIEVDTTEFKEACQSLYEMFPEYAEYIEEIQKIN